MKILLGAPTGVDKVPRELPRKHLLHTLRASDSNTLLSATTIMSRLPHHVIRTESSQSSYFFRVQWVPPSRQICWAGGAQVHMNRINNCMLRSSGPTFIQ